MEVKKKSKHTWNVTKTFLSCRRDKLGTELTILWLLDHDARPAEPRVTFWLTQRSDCLKAHVPFPIWFIFYPISQQFIWQVIIIINKRDGGQNYENNKVVINWNYPLIKPSLWIGQIELQKKLCISIYYNAHYFIAEMLHFFWVVLSLKWPTSSTIALCYFDCVSTHSAY